MSKQTAQVKSTPDIYKGIPRQSELLKTTIVEDVHGQFFIYTKPQTINIVKQAQQKVWANFDEFAAENKNTLLTYHENLFKAEPPKDQNLVITAEWCWYKIASIVLNLDAFKYVSTPKTSSGRSSEILNRKYFYGEAEDTAHSETGTLKTPQALASLRLFRRAILEHGETTGEPGQEIRHITEAALKKFVEDNAAKLKTRQEPWRIFQYYRPQLLGAKLIKHD